MQKSSKRPPVTRKRVLIFVIILFMILGTSAALLLRDDNSPKSSAVTTQPQAGDPKQAEVKPANPLAGKTLYRDDTRKVTTLAAAYRKSGNNADAELLERIASQPGVIWLTGPSADDPTARNDMEEVIRTSGVAKDQGAVPVYQLYAIPRRDACATYSNGGFNDAAAYLAWIDAILANLQTAAVFTIEADAVAHTINASCLNTEQKAARYQLLNQTTQKLQQSPKVLAAYLDAGHSDWLPDPGVLVEPLKQSGIDNVRGVAINVSFFEETGKLAAWSQQLVQKLGGNKGVVIDTSRNGKGISGESGERRWCNPAGRGIGLTPSTSVQDEHIDAYLWVKVPGESDGACGGNPTAGTFVPAIALELARNAAR